MDLAAEHVSDNSSAFVTVASTGIDTFDLLSIPAFRLVRLYKANLEPLGNLIFHNLGHCTCNPRPP